VSFSLQEAASLQVDLETATRLMREAFASWEGAHCGDDGKPPSIHVSDGFGTASCGSPEYNRDAGNANVVMFRDTVWPYASSSGDPLGQTTLTADDDGVIYDADIELNATEPLSTTETSDTLAAGQIVGQYDLLSLLTHEAGHFLGLDHSPVDDSVMQPELAPAVVRTQLSADDIAAICEVYPPDRDGQTCDDTPRGGFSPSCHASATHVASCSLQQQGTARASHAWLYGLSCLLALFVSRSRRRRSRRLCEASDRLLPALASML
jgi:hypothetical protein